MVKVDMKVRPYSFERWEDKIIIESQGRLSRKNIADKLNSELKRRGRNILRTEGSINQRIEILERDGGIKRFKGYISKNGSVHRYFSNEEIKEIERRYPKESTKSLIQEFGRNRSSFSYITSRIGIKKDRSHTYLHLYQVAGLLGVGVNTVREWLLSGLLKGNKSERGCGLYQEWRIERRDLYDFVKQHYCLFDTDRVREKTLRAVIDSTPATRSVSICQAVKILDISRAEIYRRVIKGEIPAHRGFRHWGAGWQYYVRLDESAFGWFLDLTDNEKACWITEVARLRDPDSVMRLNILIKCEPERAREVRKRISMASAADRIVKAFEGTLEGESLSALTR